MSADIPGKVCDWIERQTNLPQRRTELRGVDPEIDEPLTAIKFAAMAWRERSTGSAPGSDTGTSLAFAAEPAAGSQGGCELLTVAAAAGVIGISDRAVRRAISERRLPARIVGGRYVVDADDARAYRDRKRTA